jgi:CreA protein
MKFKTILALAIISISSASYAESRDIGSFSTTFKFLGQNNKIVVSAFDDPKIKGVTCYVARPRTGGIKGGLGLAEDPAIASVSCSQTGPIVFTDKIEVSTSGEEVFDERRSIIFKTLNINRLYDKENGVLVYVTRTTKIIEGSPATSISVVAPMTWNGTVPQKPILK